MIALSRASYRYPGGVAVGPVDLRVGAGEMVLLTGPTGCGKSTVLRLAAGLLARHGQGERGGEVRVAGVDVASLPPAARVTTIGFVGQDPDDAILAGTALDEVAFAAESAGFSAAEVDRRAREALERVGLTGFEERPPRALSGGEKQRLAIAAALSAGARVLLLDEPLAQLDPPGAVQVLELLRALAREGVAVLLVEHRLDVALDRCDRAVLMAGGRIVDDPVRGLASLHGHGLLGPGVAEVEARLGSVAEPLPEAPEPPLGAPLLALRGVRWGYTRTGDSIRDVTLAVAAGERVAVLGANGAGKSALLAAIHAFGGSGVVPVPQNPDLGLFLETVRAELAYAPTEQRRGDVGEVVHRVGRALSLDGLDGRPPQALSRGQRLRVAVAAAAAARPRVLLLDEPTSGQDHDQVERMFAGLRELLVGSALVFATHDVDLALRHATRLLVVDRGRVVADLHPDPAALEAAPGTHPLPALARWCLARGVAYGTPAEVAGRFRTAQRGGPG